MQTFFEAPCETMLAFLFDAAATAALTASDCSVKSRRKPCTPFNWKRPRDAMSTVMVVVGNASDDDG